MAKNDKNNLIDLAEFSPEQLRTLQLKLVGILEAFDSFCKENDLRYYLVEGTCIGAVRHKGIIPWDDDLDVAMPREDFEKMFRLWDNENNRYKALRPTKDLLTGVHIGLIRDSETTYIDEWAKDYDICQGIKIDVVPIDGCPDNPIKERIQKFFCLVYGLMAAQRVPNGGTKAMKIEAKIILSAIRSKKIRYWLFSFAEKQVKKYKMEDCSRVRFGYWGIYPKEIFDKRFMTEFEGKMYPIPADYDVYLKKTYGDYMKMPPEEKRKPRSTVYFYDPNTSYTKFRGTKYLVDSEDKRS